MCHLDEAGFALTLPTTSSWGPRGQRLTVPYEAAQNRRVNVIGAYFTHGPAAGTFCFESYARLPSGRKKGLGKTGRPRRHFRGQSAAEQAAQHGLRAEEVGVIDSERFLAFLWRLAGRPPDADECWQRARPLVVVLDNYSVHKNETTRTALPELQAADVYLCYLPAYSPELSAMEPLWHAVKHYEIRQRSHANLASLKDEVDAALTRKATALLTARGKTAGLLHQGA